MPIDIDVLVLPAFDDLAGLPGEAAPWRKAYDLSRTVGIEGVPSRVRYSDHGLAVVPTGIGKAAAATTTTALFSSDDLDLEGTLVLSVGVAGGPPDLAIGSVVVADRIVDWDDKCRVDPTSDGGIPLVSNPYTEGQGAFRLDAELVKRARSLTKGVELAGVDGNQSERGEPRIVGGTNLCGDELWHGRKLAEQAAWLVDEHRMEPYRVTEMEDAGTAVALSRFGHLDRYLTVRGISNYDRPEPGKSPREYLFESAFESGFEVGVKNAVRVARTVVDEQLE